MKDEKWPDDFQVSQLRVARPTDKFEEVIRFYKDGLGLNEIGSFTEHDGYTGIMLGMPGASIHLEFTSHVNGSPCPAPTKDNLLVFYVADKHQRDSMVSKLIAMGYPIVEPENSYWAKDGITIEDPDGWRIVLMNKKGFEIE
jgi:hypothetical protein